MKTPNDFPDAADDKYLDNLTYEFVHEQYMADVEAWFAKEKGD